MRIGSAEQMMELGRRIGAHLVAGDLVILDGELGAGKTTLMRGLGEGLGVRGSVTSPTFVLARRHPSLHGGPALVHVDAYRLGHPGDLADLELDLELQDAVVAVEWGLGLAEGIVADPMVIRITGIDDSREVTITGGRELDL